MRPLKTECCAWFAMLLSALAANAMAAPASSSAPAAAGPESFAATVAERSESRLPSNVPPRITIRYPARDAVARQRAIDLARGLSNQGLGVTDLVESSTRVTVNTVSYFYVEDQLGATIAARGLGPDWRLVQRRITQRPIPRPGAMELAVAGDQRRSR